MREGFKVEGREERWFRVEGKGRRSGKRGGEGWKGMGKVEGKRREPTDRPTN